MALIPLQGLAKFTIYQAHFSGGFTSVSGGDRTAFSRDWSFSTSDLDYLPSRP